MSQFTIKIEAPEIASAIENLSVALTKLFVAHSETSAAQSAEKVIRKAASTKKTAQPEVAVDNTGSSGSDQTQVSSSPPAEADAPHVAPTEKSADSAAQSEATALTHDAVKTLAALKAKKVGPKVVKGLIADTGHEQIAEIAQADVLRSLYKKLEEL
jgi:hypothetical protein